MEIIGQIFALIFILVGVIFWLFMMFKDFGGD